MKEITFDKPNMTEVRARFGKAFETGTHIVFCESRTRKPKYLGHAIVDGLEDVILRATDDPNAAILEFIKIHGEPDSIHIFKDQAIAALLFPFYAVQNNGQSHPITNQLNNLCQQPPPHRIQ